MYANLSRRQFLIRSAGLAGASLGFGAGACDRALAEIGVGIVGLGDRGRRLLGLLLRLEAEVGGPRPRVVALADVNPRHLRKAVELTTRSGPLADGSASRILPVLPQCFADFRSLLDSRDVDALVLATPVHLHATEALAAVAAGKHVYCEKPLARTAEECRQVLAAATEAGRSGRIFQVGHQRRYHPRYDESIRFIREGSAGRVLFVRAQWHASGGPRRDKPWLFRRDRSGDIVVEQACQQFDVFNWVFDAHPERSCGLGGIGCRPAEPPGRDVMDHYGAVLEYPGGAKVHLSHVSFSIPERRFSGIYELVFCEKAGIDLANAMVWTAGGQGRQLPTAAGHDTQLALNGFLRSIQSGQTPRASVEVGYQATMAALLCQKALETGRTVHWNEIEAV